ncbi:MAG: hypothetical protein EA349_13775 [Halomonadaceae bacterium]|nr:MAG: hypothetical protein EA349_13775 [Halomonadaceae bacterium]
MITPTGLEPALYRWLSPVTETGRMLATLQGLAPERVVTRDRVIADYVVALGKGCCLLGHGPVGPECVWVEHQAQGCANCPFRTGSGSGNVCRLPKATSSQGVQVNIQYLARVLRDVDAGRVAQQRFREAMAGLNAQCLKTPLTVLCLVSHPSRGVTIAGQNTELEPLLNTLGLVNWAGGLSGYLPLCRLQQLPQQPDYLLLLEPWPGQFQSRQWPVLEQVRAWQEGRILLADNSLMAAWGPALPTRLHAIREQLQGC